MNRAESRIEIILFGVLQMALIFAKLTGFIGAPWLWVFAPIWVSIGIWFFVLMFGLIVLLILLMIDSIKEGIK